jgi:hypothetical protein
MGEEGFYPPFSLTLLHDRLREGLEPSTEEREALKLPYPPLPDLIRDYQSRRPEEFKAKFQDTFKLKKIMNYRQLFSYSKLLEEAVSKWTLSGFGSTQEEKDYTTGRRGYRFARWGAYATAAASVVGFNLIYTLPLWFRSFGIGWVLVGNFAMAYGSLGLWHPLVDHYRRQMITSGSLCISARKAELDNLVKTGALTQTYFNAAEFPPNPFTQQIQIEHDKIRIWSHLHATKG